MNIGGVLPSTTSVLHFFISVLVGAAIGLPLGALAWHINRRRVHRSLVKQFRAQLDRYIFCPKCGAIVGEFVNGEIMYIQHYCPFSLLN